ncbi:MAG: response regulator transcription factor [Candidatus Kaiserbacteria bacterium]|nr:response regulator transcription factor [Candidatus Kaiserbacteria bacterium]MCB9816420.1 response regulator transcription factor [Candidatus Nomurabacteria bacterium]
MEKKILLVEDEPDIREAMAEAIADAGFAVVTAENGQAGLSTALAEHPDLILLDIVMPIMDGHSMLEQLRQDPWGKTVKVIMLTSMDDVQNIADAHEGSITDYLIKAHSSLDDIVAKVKLEAYV